MNAQLSPALAGLLPLSSRLRMARADALYVSAKRTHFVFADFFMYRSYLQKLMSFAATFANGFVLEKRTHLGQFYEGKNGVAVENERLFAALETRHLLPSVRSTFELFEPSRHSTVKFASILLPAR
jgi:hypothetical protein